jgi:lipid-A-disaccharide synthase
MKALIVAGEASGDLYGGKLTSVLRAKLPSLTLAGMGGNHMHEAGVQLLYDSHKVSVVGVFEVFYKLKQLRQAHSAIQRWIQEEKPDVAILIDFPDFNFRIARILKTQRIRTIYFISPQVWAWRRKRIDFLKKHVDLMICILPFEKQIYEAAKVPVSYVGHPLVEIVQEELAGQTPFIRGTRTLIGIMPGSRDIEMKRHLPILIQTLDTMRKLQEMDVVLIWPSSLSLAKYHIPSDVQIVQENRYSTMKACDLLLVASGTSTLESAIVGTPLLIVYRVSALSWQLGKLLVRVPYYGLVNWVAGRKCIPEFIQNDMEPSRLAPAAMELLRNDSRRRRMREDLSTIVESLGPPGAMQRVASEILRMLSAHAE